VKASPVPRLHRPTPREFRHFLERAIPVVMEGVLDDWRAPETWTFDRLEASAKDVMVRVQTRFGPGALDFEYRIVPFKTVIESARNDGRDYLVSSHLLDALPALREDLRTPPYIGPRAAAPVLFVGPKGSYSPVHYDFHHGLLAQVSGRKQVSLFRFRRRDVVRSPELRNPARLSELPCRVATPSQTLPVERWDCVLAPRELLFVPSCRHHFLRSLDATISVSFYWHTRPMRAVSRLLKLLARGHVE